MVKKTERQQAAEAFEVYYKMGSRRTLHRLAAQLQMDFMRVVDWSTAYGWEQVIDAREADLERRQQRVYRRKTLAIRDHLTLQITRLIQSMESASLGLPFDVRSPADLRAVAQAYESLVRANLAASGNSPAEAKNPRTWSDLLTHSHTDSLVENSDET